MALLRIFCDTFSGNVVGDDMPQSYQMRYENRCILHTSGDVIRPNVR